MKNPNRHEESRLLENLISTVQGMRIAVIGLGYVGLPLAIRLVERGFSVTGVDISVEVINKLLAGKSPVEMVSDDQIRRAVSDNGGLTPVLFNRENDHKIRDQYEVLLGIRVFIICVPTPLHAYKGWEPDTRWIELTAHLLSNVCEIEKDEDALPRERLVVLESTTYPGTTRSIFTPIFKRFVKATMHWYLAYSPERVNPGPIESEDGSPGSDPFRIARIVGALDKPSEDCAIKFYETIFESVHAVENLETAEMIKLVENTFRFVSIGFANEMARIARTFGLNIWDIIKAAKTKKFGLDLCFPGLIGGHCIPIDPHYLSWAVRSRRQTVTFVDVAEKAHQEMRRDALELIQRLLNQQGKGVLGASILFFGVAYKKNVSDVRESAVLDLMKKISFFGAHISFWDPIRSNRTSDRPLRLTYSKEEQESLPAVIQEGLTNPINGVRHIEPVELKGSWKSLRQQILSSHFDCVVIATDHDVFRASYQELILKGPPIADLRNAVPTWLELWLQGQSLSPRKAQEMKERLSDHSRYKLLGVN